MSTVAIGPDLGIEAAADLKAVLLPHFASKRSVVIDASAVERVHSSSLQVLFAFVRDRQQAGHQTQIERCAPPLQDAARLLGMSAAIGLDEDTPA
jgi:anti-anti-sigma regulatory factor